MAESDWNRFALRNSWSIRAILGSAGNLHVFFLKHLVSYTYMGAKWIRDLGEGGSNRGTACTWKFNKHDHEFHPTNWLVEADTASSYNLWSFFTEGLKRTQNVYTYFPVYSKCFVFSAYRTASKISLQQRQFNIEQCECFRPHSGINIADCSRQVTCSHFTALMFRKFTAPISFWYDY